MLSKTQYILLIFLLLKVNSSCSQDLTGKWEGDLGNAEFLQVNIVQVGENLCGYTWDYVNDDNKDFCKAYFTGNYDKTRRLWILTGTSFFANSGDHVLMRLLLSYHIIDGEKILSGKEIDPSDFISILALFFGQSVYLRKVANTPDQMLDNMKECLKVKQPPKNRLKTTPANSIEKQIKKEPEKKVPAKNIKKIVIPVKTVPVKVADTIKKIKKPVVPVIILKDSTQLFTQMTKRKNSEMSHLVVYEKNITLEVFDNGIVDSDTVSIFYNGKLILSHQRLSEKAIVIPISLDEKTSQHEIILFAENLGSIPPNTALVVVHAGDKRYELYASSSLTENAVIRFEYKLK